MSAVARLEIKTLVSKLIPLDMEAPLMDTLWEHLDTVLSYEIHNAFFMKAMSNKVYVRDIWDGKDHLFNVKNGEFLTGLLPYIQDALDQFKIPHDVIDHRPKYSSTKIPPVLSPDLSVREYQREAVASCMSAGRGVIWARPRSGKTVMEIDLVSKLNIYPVLSICQSIDVAKQTIEKFEKFSPDIKVGLIGDGECNIQDVTVATIQSLSAAYNIREKIPKNAVERTPSQEKKLAIQKLVESAKFVWVDECHHATSNTHKFILRNKIYAAQYVFGCSGTPFREDNTNLLLEALLGPIIYEIDYSKLIEGGYLVKPTIHLVSLSKKFEIESDAYASIYKQAVSDNDYRNGVIAKIARTLRARDKTCMILVSKVTHGKNLAELIPSAEFSYSKSKNRELLWKRLQARVLHCLITTLGDEGVDIPSLDATIIAAGGESAIKVFQRLRCLTPSEGKTKAIIVDFMDPYKYLIKHSKKRERLYKSEPSFEIKYRKDFL